MEGKLISKSPVLTCQQQGSIAGVLLAGVARKPMEGRVSTARSKREASPRDCCSLYARLESMRTQSGDGDTPPPAGPPRCPNPGQKPAGSGAGPSPGRQHPPPGREPPWPSPQRPQRGVLRRRFPPGRAAPSPSRLTCNGAYPARPGSFERLEPALAPGPHHCAAGAGGRSVPRPHTPMSVLATQTLRGERRPAKRKGREGAFLSSYPQARAPRRTSLALSLPPPAVGSGRAACAGLAQPAGNRGAGRGRKRLGEGGLCRTARQ